MSKVNVLTHIVAFTQVTRLFMSTTLGLAAVAGARLSGVSDLPFSTMLLLLTVGFLTSAGGFALNDLQDMDRDRAARHKPLVRGDMKPGTAGAISVVFIVLALCVSSFMGPSWLAVSVAQVLLLFAYSRIKRWSGAVANVVTALLCASGILYGSLLGATSWPLAATLASAFLLVLGREVLKDVLDTEDDRLARITTIPVTLGRVAACWIAASLCLLAIVLGSLVFANAAFPASWLGPLVLIGTGVLLCWNAATQTERSLQWTLHSTAIAMLATVLLSTLPTT